MPINFYIMNFDNKFKCLFNNLNTNRNLLT